MDSPVEAVKMLTSARISPILSSKPERDEDEEPIAMTEDLFFSWVENERRPLVLDEEEGRQWEEEDEENKGRQMDEEGSRKIRAWAEIAAIASNPPSTTKPEYFLIASICRAI